MYRNFSYRGVYIWNKLQDHINIYSSYSTFSTALKTFLLSNDLNYRVTQSNYLALFLCQQCYFA